MNKSLVKTANTYEISKTVKQTESILPEFARYQLACPNSPLFTVKDMKEIVKIQKAIKKLQLILRSSASATEITKAINPIFNMLSSQNNRNIDLQVEIAEWVKLLEGEPLWAINAGVEKVCRTQKFRHFCDLNLAIKEQVSPILNKITKLKAILEKSLSEIEYNKHTEQNSISFEQFKSNMHKLAKKGSPTALQYIKNSKIPKH
jgi:hypothetical protein